MTAITTTRPAWSIIVPTHNRPESLRRAVRAITAMDRPPTWGEGGGGGRARGGFELIVVDDGGDADLSFVREYPNVRLHRQPNAGPAAARNHGSRLSRGDLLIFIDADVVVHRDTLARFVQCFDADPSLAAAFGSYDDHPADRGLVSLYKNLVHHFVHQHAAREASTFWAGCGAIRREEFEAVGGFSSQYQRPAIEDIHLGLDLHERGQRILACPEIQATHLKRWTFGDLVRTDIRARAMPWSRLICEGGRLPNDLNVDIKSRIAAALSLALLAAIIIALPLIPYRPAAAPIAVATVAGLLTLLIAMHFPLFRLFYKQGGVRLIAASLGLHSFTMSTAPLLL